MSYLIDLYREVRWLCSNLPTLVPMSRFPQLIAGPIVRYQTVADQLRQRKEDINSYGYGVSRLCWFGEKVLLANNLGLLWQEVQQLPAEELATITAWLGMIAFALRLYYDFSGYSDMAVGLGGCLVLPFLESIILISLKHYNFGRWHISLGSWFREYVYIPLGGSR